MNIETIFTVKNKHLSLLDEYTAVEFFRKLLWAEARSLGIELSNIKVPREVKKPDGGIDALVDKTQIPAGNGLIKTGITHYQIKSGRTIPNIKDELFGTGNEAKKENLKKGIQDCFENESCGTYILVCTGIELVYKKHKEILAKIKNYLEQCGYEDPNVEVWSQDNLINFLETFPSLALSLNGNDKTAFQSHQSWSQNDTMKYKFVSGPAQRNLVAKIRRKLRTNKDAIHIRILGESGSGKSKLVLNATRVKDLSPLVIHCEASQFKDSDLLNYILRADNHFEVILVVDECNSLNRAVIWDKLKNRGSRIKLITISNDHEEKTSDLAPDFIPLLEEEQIQNILIQEHRIPKVYAHRWAEFCSGLPGVAHMIGENLKSNQENLLAPLSITNFWERCVVGGDDLTNSDVADRWPVLRYIALFKQFGFKGNVSGEFKAISDIVKKAFPLITRQRFKKIVLDLQKRGILKGDYTLHITPKVLHIKLWLEWWENYYDDDLDLAEFTQYFTTELRNWFHEMFKYAADSEDALKIVKKLLGPNGHFQSNPLTNLSSSFFVALTEAAPASALECLKQTIGKCDKDTLIQFTARRNVVWALEKIAIWRNLFPDAARLFLALGEAENERISNNASGVFAELFSLGPGAVAPTEALPIERLPVLKEAFASGSKERRALAFKACRKGLISDHFSRISGAEYQGLQKEPDLWYPKTNSEWREAYRSLWQLLSEQLEHLPEDERTEAAEILLGHAGSLGRIPYLGDMVVNTVRIITENGYANEKQVIETISQILYHDDSYVENKGLPPEIRQSFEQLRGELIGSDFHSLMQRYVGMDMVEDLLIQDRDKVDKVKPHLESLAKQSIDNPALLKSELSWLVTTEAQNGNKFGYELGKKDESLSLLPMLLDAQRNVRDNASTYFLGGYFHVIFDKDLALWEKQLDALYEDTTLNPIIPSLTHYSGLTDQAGLRILHLAESGIIKIYDFGLFIYKNAITSLSESVFHAWIEFLLNITDRSTIDIALKLFYNYYISRKPELTLPNKLTFRLLSHPELFEESDNYQYDTMTDFYWTETANALLNHYPQKALELVQLILVPFGNDSTIFDSFSQSCSFLTETTKKFPEEVWEYVGKYLGRQDNFSKTVSLARWLRETDLSETEKEKGALTLIPREKIWEWVDQDVENRAWYLASEFVPKTLLIEEWHDSLARDLLVRYGDQEDVRSTLISNYSTEGFSGPASLYYEEKLHKLVDIQNNDNDEKVNYWINEFVPFLEEQIEHAKIDEERKF